MRASARIRVERRNGRDEVVDRASEAPLSVRRCGDRVLIASSAAAPFGATVSTCPSSSGRGRAQTSVRWRPPWCGPAPMGRRRCCPRRATWRRVARCGGDPSRRCRSSVPCTDPRRWSGWSVTRGVCWSRRSCSAGPGNRRVDSARRSESNETAAHSSITESRTGLTFRARELGVGRVGPPCPDRGPRRNVLGRRPGRRRGHAGCGLDADGVGGGGGPGRRARPALGARSGVPGCPGAGTASQW